MSSLVLTKTIASGIPAPSAGKTVLFCDTTALTQWQFRDEANNLVALLDNRNVVTGISGKTFVAPVLGAATGTSLAVTGPLTTTGATGGIGYATGAGGVVVQATSKSTAFTLSKMCGTITFAADSLAAGQVTTATWTNTLITATDVIVLAHQSGGSLGAYNCVVTPATGSATIYLRNIVGVTLSEAPVFRFVIIRSVIA